MQSSESQELRVLRQTSAVRQLLLRSWRRGNLEPGELCRILVSLDTLERELLESARGTQVTDAPLSEGNPALEALLERLAPSLRSRLQAARGTDRLAPRAEPRPPKVPSTGAEVRERYGSPAAATPAPAAPPPTAPAEGDLPVAALAPEPTPPAPTPAGPGAPATPAARPRAPEAPPRPATPPLPSPPPPPRPAPAPPPTRPRRPTEWSKILDHLREGGSTTVLLAVATILVIGGSLALTIYFWETFRAAPILALGGVTLLFFLAGLFLRRRLQVIRTGNTMLVIATLLVPATLLAGRALELPLWAVLGTAVILSLVVLLSGRTILERAWLPVATLYVVQGLLLALPPEGSLPPEAGILGPILVYVVGMGLDLRARLRVETTYERLGVETVLAVALATYASLILPAAALLGEEVTLLPMAATLSLLLLAVPALLHGAFLTRRAGIPDLHRAVGTGLVLLGLALMLGGGLTTGGEAHSLLLWSLTTTAVLVTAVRVTRQEVLHVGTGLTATILWVTLVHLVAGWFAGGFSWGTPSAPVTALWCLPLVALLGGLRVWAGERVTGRVFLSWAIILAVAIVGVTAHDLTAGTVAFAVLGLLVLVGARLLHDGRLLLPVPVLLGVAGCYLGLALTVLTEPARVGIAALGLGLVSLCFGPVATRIQRRLAGAQESLKITQALQVEAAIAALLAFLLTVVAGLADGLEHVTVLLPGLLPVLAFLWLAVVNHSVFHLVSGLVLLHVQLALMVGVVTSPEDHVAVSQETLAGAILALMVAVAAPQIGKVVARGTGRTAVAQMAPIHVAGVACTIYALLALGVVLDDHWSHLVTATGALISVALLVAAYHSGNPWRSYPALVCVYFTILHAYGVQVPEGTFQLDSAGFRSTTMGLTTVLLLLGLVLRGWAWARDLFGRPALVTAGVACVGPLLPVLVLPVEGTDVGLCLSVAAVLYAVGAGLRHEAPAWPATLALLGAAAMGGMVEAQARPLRDLLAHLLLWVVAAGFVLRAISLVWRPAAGYRLQIRETWRVMGQWVLTLGGGIAVTAVGFHLLDDILALGNIPLPTRQAAILLLCTLVLAAIPLRRGKPTQLHQEVAVTVRVLCIIAAVLWMQVALTGMQSIGYVQVASAVVVGGLAVFATFGGREDLLPILRVMAVLAFAVGWADPWTYSASGAWLLLALLLLLASRRRGLAGPLYWGGAALLFLALGALGARLSQHVVPAPVHLPGRLLAGTLVTTLVALTRPWSLVAGFRPQARQVAAAGSVAVVALTGSTVGALLLTGKPEVQSIPVLLRLTLLLPPLLVAGQTFLGAWRQTQEPKEVRTAGRIVSREALLAEGELLVYGGQVLLVLAVLAVRATFPDFFGHGFFRRFWPYIMLAVSVGAALLAGVLRQTPYTVFVRPFRRAGLLLPVLPLIGIWALVPDLTSRALMLAAIAAFYLGVGLAERRAWPVFLAAGIGNVALWTLWVAFDIGVAAVPQLFAIPLGLTLIAAAQLQRERLPAEAVSTATNGGLLIIYLAASWKLFYQTSVGHALFLAGISLLGILVGLGLRQRAVTLTGLVFLVLVILTQLVRAAQEHPWLWWAFGITAGVAILAFVGWSESRKRSTPESPPPGARAPPPGADQEGS